MSRGLKIKQSVYGARGIVTGISVSPGGSYTVAPTMSIAVSDTGEQAVGQIFMQYDPLLLGIFMGGTETVAYQAGVPWVMPSTPGSLSTPWFSPGLDNPLGYLGGITGTTGTAGQVSLAGGVNLIKGQSITINSGGMGGLVDGATYYVLASNGGAAAVQLTSTYADAIAGVATLVTTVAAGSANFTLGTFANTAGQQWTIIAPTHLGAYITLPAGLLNVNIPGGGQGLTTNASAMTWQLGPSMIYSGGGGYSSPPAVNFTGGTGAGAAATAIMGVATGTGSGLLDIGYNSFDQLTSPVIPTSMTTTEFLGVVGGGYPGGIDDAAYPSVKSTAWIPGAAAEDDVYIVAQKGATRFQVAGVTTYAASTMVPGQTYIIGVIGNTLWQNYGASTNAVVGDVFTATSAGTGTGEVSFLGTCSLVNQAPGSVTVGNMQITVTVNSTAFRASRISNKFVWDYTAPQAVRYAADFFAGAAATINTLKAGAEADTFLNGTGNLILGEVENYT